MQELRPGTITNPQQPEDEGLATSTPTVSDEMAQIDAGVEQTPATPVPPSVSSFSPPPPPEEPAQEPVDTPEYLSAAPTDKPDTSQSEDQAIEPLLSWQAAEPANFNIQDNTPIIAVAGVSIIFLAIFIFISGSFNLSSVFSILVVVLAVATLMISKRRPGHLETYAIYEDGVNIGEQFYPYEDLLAFSVLTNTSASSIELDPAQRFMLRLTMYLDPRVADAAIEVLDQLLPRNDSGQDFLDKLTRRLRL